MGEKSTVFVKEYSFTSIERALSWHCHTMQRGECRFCPIKQQFPDHDCLNPAWVSAHSSKVSESLGLSTKSVVDHNGKDDLKEQDAQSNFISREILAKLTNMSLDTPTKLMVQKLIFGGST